MTIFVADTDIIAFPEPRRFLAGIAVQMEEPIYTTPTVIDECITTLRYAEAMYWNRRIQASNARITQKLQPAVLQATGKAVEVWVRESLASSKGPIRCLEQGEDLLVAVMDIAARIPGGIFNERSASQYTNDLIIMTEAITAGAGLVITKNRRSIDHQGLNQWLKDSGLRNRDLVYSPDEGLANWVGNDNLLTYAHLSSITMTLSDSSRSEREDYSTMMRFLDELGDTFPDQSCRVRREEDYGKSTRERWKKARKNLALPEWQDARWLEMDRVSRTRAAATDAGFQIAR